MSTCPTCGQPVRVHQSSEGTGCFVPVESEAERVLTKDGEIVRIGLTVICPNGHEQTYRPSDRLSGRIYCVKGECWDDGCQGDSGSGTYYDAAQLVARKLAGGGE